jgi:hypothetical protein
MRSPNPPEVGGICLDSISVIYSAILLLLALTIISFGYAAVYGLNNPEAPLTYYYIFLAFMGGLALILEFLCC